MKQGVAHLLKFTKPSMCNCCEAHVYASDTNYLRKSLRTVFLLIAVETGNQMSDVIILEIIGNCCEFH